MAKNRDTCCCYCYFHKSDYRIPPKTGLSWKVPRNCSLYSLRRYDKSMYEENSEPPGESQE
ncbi:unnamed protein product [Brassica rapa]|uniref:Uncharacterized protein n=2 Tax=Brassica TaxID=3705 RepID=A0A8D9DBM2_BRACM|nr:unnamed protein product [Brassica napus]CAG7871209.1 unnamed protein product [Brassica rapa]